MIKVAAGCLRVITAALYYAIFALGGMGISLLFFTLIRIFIKNRTYRTALSRKLTSLSFRLYLFTGELFQIFSIRFKGLEKLEKDRGVLYIANHPSLLDVVIFISRTPNACCLIKASILHNPFMSGIARCNDYIANDEDPRVIMDKSNQALKLSILLF